MLSVFLNIHIITPHLVRDMLFMLFIPTDGGGLQTLRLLRSLFQSLLPSPRRLPQLTGKHLRLSTTKHFTPINGHTPAPITIMTPYPMTMLTPAPIIEETSTAETPPPSASDGEPFS